MSTKERIIGAIAIVVAIGVAATGLLAGSASAQRQGRFVRVVDGVRLSFLVKEPGWERSPILRPAGSDSLRFGRLGISKSITGPQGAEAIMFFTSFPDAELARPCTKVLGTNVGRSAADLAAAVAEAPGTTLVRAPSNVSVGGRPAKHVVVKVRRAIGCVPGFFYAWRSECRGPCWVESSVGDTIRVWIVSVRGKRLFFAAETTTEANRRLEREIAQIVDSIRFG